MTSSIQVSDDAAAAVAVSPDTRVKLSDIEDYIDSSETFNLNKAAVGAGGSGHPSFTIMTICAMVMKNGFVVLGKSAPADPMNFNAELGAKLAREDCIRQLWPLMGFALRDRLAEQRFETPPLPDDF